MREVRQTVPPEAVLQVPKIRPHRNPVQGNDSMWLLRPGTQLPRLPVEIGHDNPEEMHQLPRGPRGLEPGLPGQTRGAGQDPDCTRNPRTLLPDPGTEGD